MTRNRKNIIFSTGGSRCMNPALILLSIMLAVLAVSCSADAEASSNIVEASFTMSEEKELKQDWVDAVASYDYTAECLSRHGGIGETREFKPIFVGNNGVADLGPLEKGKWKFTVRAFNINNIQLYEGTTTQYVSDTVNNIPIVLKLRKIGLGQVSFNISSRSTGDETVMSVYWRSHDGRDNGSSKQFAFKTDGNNNTFMGTISVPENRYSMKVEIATKNTILASDITDVLVIAKETTNIRGVMNGQEDQMGTLVPIVPETPTGHIEVEGTLKAGYTATVKWVSDGKWPPHRVIWYMDGNVISDGRSQIEITLPAPGTHLLTATAIRNKEAYSGEYQLNLASNPVMKTGGSIIYDRGELYGDYWIDEYGEFYRINDQQDTWRFTVANTVDTGNGTAESPYYNMKTKGGKVLSGSADGKAGHGAATTDIQLAEIGMDVDSYNRNGEYYRPAIAKVMEYRGETGLDWYLPTEKDAFYIMKEMNKPDSRIEKCRFVIGTVQDETSMMIADPFTGTISFEPKEEGKAGLVLVRYI